MDLTESIIPTSAQINADDLIAGPITVTITDAYPAGAEQPVDITLLKPQAAPTDRLSRCAASSWPRGASSHRPTSAAGSPWSDQRTPPAKGRQDCHR